MTSPVPFAHVPKKQLTMTDYAELKACPIGIQTFSEIITEDYLYIDKTQYIHEMVHSKIKYCFLSRPRRFGKSLLVSTLHSYFAGEKELFKGLAIDKYEKEWTEYPVLHFDMSLGKHMDEERLEEFLRSRLKKYEEEYGITQPAKLVNDRLTNLITTAYERTGKKVVILIDEYDAPLLDVVHEEVMLPKLRNIMRNFYSPLKGCDRFLHFVFLTGITKFSQLSIFSELNNIANISMNERFAAICGISKEELQEQMGGYIHRIAGQYNVSDEEMLGMLTQKYDGYHFSWPSPDIYNPYSLLNAFFFDKLDNYWFGSGTPTYLIEMMRRFNTLPSQLDDVEALASDFDAPSENLQSITPLLYQSGYLTIKDYEPFAGLYTLGIPNKEIEVGLMRSLLPYYIKGIYVQQGNTTIAKMYLAIRKDDMDGALRLLQTFLETIPQCDNTNYEGHYQQMLFIIFSLFGMYVDVEVRTADGRVDIVMQSATRLYIIEVKINRSAASAIEQIEKKAYFKRFALLPLPRVLVGINFDCEKHTVTDWEIRER